MKEATIGSFRILARIGEGGMGSVYRAVDTMLEREVAIKQLRPELARDPQLVERFRTEAIALARLNHPCVAAVHAFLREGDEYFLVLEYVRGETLDRVIRRDGALAWPRAIAIACAALEGIEHAHAQGIIHRDLKPENIMVTPEGTVKVMDFGIARVVGSAHLTRSGHTVGTLEYMAPEQVRGAETDARTDVYAMGAVLYEMLTGSLPFTGSSDFELMQAHLERAPAPPRERVAGIPEGLEAAVLRALAKEPERRFDSAGAFHAALAACATLPHEAVTLKPTRVAPALAGPRRRPVLLYAAAGLAVVGAATIAIVVSLREKEPARPLPPPPSAEVTIPVPAATAVEAPAEPRPTPAPPPPAPRPKPKPKPEPAPKVEPEPPPATTPAPEPTPEPAPEPAPPSSFEGFAKQLTNNLVVDDVFEAIARDYPAVDRRVRALADAAEELPGQHEDFLDEAGRWEPAGDDRALYEDLQELESSSVRFRNDFHEIARRHDLDRGASAWSKVSGTFHRVKRAGGGTHTPGEDLTRLQADQAAMAACARRIDGLLVSSDPGPQVRDTWKTVREQIEGLGKLLQGG